MAYDVLCTTDEETLPKLNIQTVLCALAKTGQVVSQDPRSRVIIVDSTEDPHQQFFLKTFDYLKSRKKWRYLWRPSHCLREYENLQYLRGIGVLCPKPLASGERRGFGLPIAAFLITAAMVGYQQLETSLKSGTIESKKRRQVIQVLAEQVGVMHNANYIDRDLKFRNILLSDGGEVKLAHLDSTQGCCLYGRAWTKGVIHDLATLDKHAPEFFSNRERLRFLSGYAKIRRLGARDKRALARAVAARRAVLWARGGGEPSLQARNSK